MKCFIINSSWLNSFNIWSAEFFTLLEKKEYEEILKLSYEEIINKVKILDLTNKEVLNLELVLGQFLKKLLRQRLNIFQGVNTPQKNQGFWSENKKDFTEKEKEQNKIYLNSKARINKEEKNIKQNYVFLLASLKIAQENLKKNEISLKEQMKRTKSLILKLKENIKLISKIESKGGLKKE